MAAEKGTEADEIGKLIVNKVPSLEKVEVQSLWKDQKVVIVFFRRFGCIFCRHTAKEISLLKPILAKHNVRLVGIGMDQIGIEQFAKDGYFDGELFIDPSKETYKALGLKRMGYVTMFTSLFSKSSRNAYNKSRSDKISGNFKGDGFQNGGTLIVEEGGSKVLLSYKAENPADHVANEDVLAALGISDSIPNVIITESSSSNPTDPGNIANAGTEAEAVIE